MMNLTMTSRLDSKAKRKKTMMLERAPGWVTSNGLHLKFLKRMIQTTTKMDRIPKMSMK